MEGVSRFSVENFLSHSTEKYCRGTLLGFKKILVSKIFMHKKEGAVSRFSVVILKLKNVGKGWDSNPYLPLQNPLVLPTVPWQPLEFLTNVSEIIKIFRTTAPRTEDQMLENPVVLTLLLFLNKKS